MADHHCGAFPRFFTTAEGGRVQFICGYESHAVSDYPECRADYEAFVAARLQRKKVEETIGEIQTVQKGCKTLYIHWKRDAREGWTVYGIETEVHDGGIRRRQTIVPCYCGCTLGCAEVAASAV